MDPAWPFRTVMFAYICSYMPIPMKKRLQRKEFEVDTKVTMGLILAIKFEGKNLVTNDLARCACDPNLMGFPRKWCWVQGFRLQVSVITGKICCLVDVSYVQFFTYRDACSADLRRCSFTKHLQCQLQGME